MRQSIRPNSFVVDRGGADSSGTERFPAEGRHDGMRWFESGEHGKQVWSVDPRISDNAAYVKTPSILSFAKRYGSLTKRCPGSITV